MTTTIDRVLRSNLKLRHLQLLVALDQFRHLGRTAQFLSVSQPALSKTLAEVETLFGTVLFARSTKGTLPTATGLTVIRFARSVIADYERTREELAAVASGSLGRASVGAMVVAIPSLLTGALALLRREHPQANVVVEEGDLTRLLPRLRVGELDLIVGRLEPGYAAPDLLTEALLNESMCLVCRPGHALLGHRRVSWAQLEQQAWVMPPPWAASRVKLHQAFYRHRLNPPANTVETASFYVMLMQLRQHDAVGFVADGVARQLEQDGLACRLPVKLLIELPAVGLIMLRERRLPILAQHLAQALRLQAHAIRPALPSA